MNLFESLTGAEVKDCITTDDKLVFIVTEETVGKAVGKGGSNIQRVERALKKSVKIVGYSSDITTFVTNLVAPLRLEHIRQEGTTLTIVPKDNRTRSLIIGRGGEELRKMELILKRYFDVSEVKVPTLSR